MSYLDTLKALNPSTTKVEQFKSCRCGWAWYGNNALIYSYSTLVGAIIGGVYYRTTEKYSASTTRQLNKMGQYIHYPVFDADVEQLQDLVITIKEMAV